MNNPGCSETTALLAGLLAGFVDIRSVWSIDHEAALLVFADRATLHRLQLSQVAGVKILGVSEGDAVQSWAWRQSSASEAYYDEARWAEDGTTVVRVRRKARLIWQRPADAK